MLIIFRTLNLLPSYRITKSRLAEVSMMSYKVEISADEHETVLGQSIQDWSKQPNDVHLVSKEGHRIFSHRILLSFYSSQLQQIFNEPSVAFSPNPVSISVPSSSSSISSLLNILVTGKCTVKNRSDLEEVQATARVLGFKLNNCVIDRGVSQTSRSGLTILKLPQTFSNQSLLRTSSSDKLGSSSKKELFEETLNEETTSSVRVQKETDIIKDLKKRKFQGKTLRKESTDEGIKHKCDVCGLYVKTRKYLVKHRSKKHGLKTKRENHYNKYQSVEVEKVAVVKEEVVDEVGIEDIKNKVKNQCETCLRSFSKKDKLKRHMFIHLPDSEKPHKCHYCNKGFTQKAQLTVHLERHHNIENLEVKVKKDSDVNQFEFEVNNIEPQQDESVDLSDVILQDYDQGQDDLNQEIEDFHQNKV